MMIVSCMFRLQRDKYAKHASKAKNQPSKYLSIILDGMDQNKTAIPHFSRHSKTTQGIWKLKTHLTGAILHGKGILGFFDVGQFKVTILLVKEKKVNSHFIIIFLFE